MIGTVLTETQIAKIHAASLDVLRRVGVVVPHPEMLSRFADAGAVVDFEAQKVRIFGHMGICGVDQASSLEMLVLQNEVISYVESVMREIDFGDEAIGLDVIESVGPGGSFIDTDHTAAHFRRELWFPRLLDRQYYEAWSGSAARGADERCADRLAGLLTTHEVEPVDCDLDATLTGIVAAARRDLAGRTPDREQ